MGTDKVGKKLKLKLKLKSKSVRMQYRDIHGLPHHGGLDLWFRAG